MALEFSKSIEIDMAHRLVFHHSKCKNLHGHRYKIVANCSITETGISSKNFTQKGLVLDFSFLKEILVEKIDIPCDHGLTLNIQDAVTLRCLGYTKDDLIKAEKEIQDFGFHLSTKNEINTKIYLIADEPTAENLAKHWYLKIAPLVLEKSARLAWLKSLIVYETPTCSATYFGENT